MDKVQGLIDKVREYKPELLKDRQFREELEFFRVFPPEEYPEDWHLFEQAVNEQLEKVMLDPLSHDLPVEMRYVSGIHLGTTPAGEAFIPYLWMTRNMFLAGETGSGKTNTLMHLAKQLHENDKDVWIFDFKDEFQELEREGFLTIRWEDLRLNPLNCLEPRNVGRNLRLFQDIFGHSQGLWHASQALLGKVLEQLYLDYKAHEDQAWPSLNALRLLLMQWDIPSGRTETRRYRDRLLNRLEDVLLTQDREEFALESQIFDCQQGFRISKLMQSSIVFKLDGMKNIAASLVAELLMVAAYQYQIAHQKRRGLDLVIMADEAKYIFHKGRERAFEGEMVPMVNKLLGETREYGISLVLTDHQLTELTSAVANNSHLKLIMQLSSGDQINQAVDDAGLSDRQRQEAYRIQRGQAICKVSGQQPFRVTIPRFR